MNETPTPADAENSDLMLALARTGHVIDNRLDAALERFSLSPAKMGLLWHLSQAREPLALGQLAERLACVKSNVTQLVDRLEADGLVRRVPDPDDRRSVRAMITHEGRRRFEAARLAQVEAEREMLAGLAPEEKAVLARLLARLGERPDRP